MSTSLQGQPIVGQAYEKFQHFNRDEKLHALDEAHQRFLHTQAADMDEAHKKGKAERDIEIAKNMMNKGCDPGFIAEMTGISSIEIDRLEQRHSETFYSFVVTHAIILMFIKTHRTEPSKVLCKRN